MLTCIRQHNTVISLIARYISFTAKTQFQTPVTIDWISIDKVKNRFFFQLLLTVGKLSSSKNGELNCQWFYQLRKRLYLHWTLVFRRKWS
jgi:hypothetical protein